MTIYQLWILSTDGKKLLNRHSVTQKTLVFVCLISILCFGVCPVKAEPAEITIDKAYKLIPHERTPYKPEESSLSSEEKQYLNHLFFVTDLSLQKRMMMLHYFRTGRDPVYLETYNREISNILSSFKLTIAPTKTLQEVEDTIVIAINQQRKFFNEWHNSRNMPLYMSLQKNYTQDKWVKASHQNLLKAYSLLMRAYPNETAHNKKAFYDHLCALDFI